MITATVYTVNVSTAGAAAVPSATRWLACKPGGTSSQTPTPSMHSATKAKNVTQMPPGTPVSRAS